MKGNITLQDVKKREGSTDISWRRNSMDSRSDPVILLHFPLHRFDAEITGVPTSSEAIVSDHSLFRQFSQVQNKVTIDSMCIMIRCLVHSSYEITSMTVNLCDYHIRRLYDHLHILPANSTQYILQALKPRLAFNITTRLDSCTSQVHCFWVELLVIS